ncbi:c-type cytochrome [Flavobacterium covae]|uniref:c-type cytochrome n=1 Tax=Flavobacterium covae TaxID=2906076 RepID=UPI00339ADEE9
MLDKKIIGAIVLGSVLFSCSKKAIAPTTSVESKTEVVKELPAEIAEGKSLYENNCAKCHKLFPASKHDKAGWAKTVDRMTPKAKITDEQKNLVYNYLTYGM